MIKAINCVDNDKDNIGLFVFSKPPVFCLVRLHETFV